MKGASDPEMKANSPLDQILVQVFWGLLLVLILGAYLPFQMVKKRPELINTMKKKPVIFSAMGSLMLAFSLFFSSVIASSWGLGLQISLLVGGFWSLGFSVSILGLFLFKKPLLQIKVSHLRARRFQDWDYFKLATRKSETPIGTSLISGESVSLMNEKRIEHMLIAGASGQGKTTALRTLLYHDFLHRRPVILIDPKGEGSDIERVLELARLAGRSRDEVEIFWLAHPEESSSYNPLKNGTPEQIKGKLMEGLQLTHEFYGAQASLFLGSLISGLHLLGETITLGRLLELTVRRDKLDAFLEALKRIPVTEKSERILGKVIRAREVKLKDLEGLIAQLSTLTCDEFFEIVNPSPKRPELDLENIVKERKIAYFALNRNGYGDFSNRLGKLILQDIKALSNRLQASQIKADYDFISCFVEEFGSFATKDFADFFKMTRSAKIGVCTLFQSLADLRAVSPEFSEQISQSTCYKLIFRTDIVGDVEIWSQMAGTVNTTEETERVEHGIFGQSATGDGSLRKVKEMRIEYDVFKNLATGQAVLIDKGQKSSDHLCRVDLVKIHHLRSSVYKNKHDDSKFDGPTDSKKNAGLGDFLGPLSPHKESPDLVDLRP